MFCQYGIKPHNCDLNISGIQELPYFTPCKIFRKSSERKSEYIGENNTAPAVSKVFELATETPFFTTNSTKKSKKL